MYLANNFRKTQSGWVADVREADALLSYSVPMCEVNAQDCKNFKDACEAQKTLPVDAENGDVFDIGADHYIADEIAAYKPAWMEARIKDGVSSPAWFAAQPERNNELG